MTEKEKCEHDPKYIILLKEILPNHKLLSCVVCKKEWATVPDYVEEIRNQTRKELIDKIFEDGCKHYAETGGHVQENIGLSEFFRVFKKRYGVDA